MRFLPGINEADGYLRIDSATIQFNTHEIRRHLDGRVEEFGGRL